MSNFIIGSLVAIIVSFMLMWAISTFNAIQTLLIKINEVEANIDSALRKRFDLIVRASIIIRELLNKKDFLEYIESLKDKNISNFDLDRELVKGLHEIENYRNKRSELEESQELNEINKDLAENEIDIIACRKYYNSNISKYNKIVKSFPSMLIASISRNKPRLYYDGKNMDDDIVNDFKL